MSPRKTLFNKLTMPIVLIVGYGVFSAATQPLATDRPAALNHRPGVAATPPILRVADTEAAPLPTPPMQAEPDGVPVLADAR